jgi:glycerophosphoryl diester phosphodiesterase
MALFDLQGHRGARGLAPENTLPSFELALDAGVSTIETDLHLTKDGHAVLFHDECISQRLCTPAPPSVRLVATLTLAELRRFQTSTNPEPARFPQQRPLVTPVAALFCQARGLSPFAIPTLSDFIEFTQAYAGAPGQQAGKTAEQRQRAAQLRFDLEFKHVPWNPEFLSDPGRLEGAVLATVQSAGVVEHTIARSFDHRAVRALKEMEPRLTGTVLIANTAPVDPARLAKEALAHVIGPDYHFVDEDFVRRAHDGGVKVIPWTVNDPDAWAKLLAWGVDGMTTDYPDRLAAFLKERGVEVL